MNLSLFRTILNNRKFIYRIEVKKSDLIQEIKYFIEEQYTNNPWYIGEVHNDFFKLRKVKKALQIPLDFSYNAQGKFKEVLNGYDVNYKIGIINYSLKHLSICVVPSLILIYIFSHYDSIYILIPLIYFLVSDLIFNFKMYFLIKNYNVHFISFLKRVEQRVKSR